MTANKNQMSDAGSEVWSCRCGSRVMMSSLRHLAAQVRLPGGGKQSDNKQTFIVFLKDFNHIKNRRASHV